MYRYVFDIGGALVRYNAEELANFISEAGDYDPDDVKSLLNYDLLYKIETGRMSELEFYKNYVCNVLPD